MAAIGSRRLKVHKVGYADSQAASSGLLNLRRRFPTDAEADAQDLTPHDAACYNLFDAARYEIPWVFANLLNPFEEKRREQHGYENCSKRDR